MHIAIVQQGVWHMAKESMPLAAGYLAAMIRSDTELSNITCTIHNFPGTMSPFEMAVDLLRGPRPDVVAFSVLGWNFRQFGAVSSSVKQAYPGVRVVFGGNHVANQARRVFQLHDCVDVVVNGEGEFTFRDLVRTYAAGGNLADVGGISYRDGLGELVTTEPPERIFDLDLIPSPVLSRAIPLVDDSGQFRYDVALMETNRGCPYKCSFCFWGGAVGQKVRCFSRERLRAELKALAGARAETIVLCDANFGMLKQDEEFVDDLIEIRRATGFPQALETSWAKNKSKTFYSIVSKMQDEGLQTSFTLALQTLDDDTLATMNRRNMKINDWKELAKWLKSEGLDAYAELIWGAPGQTPESFLRGYDELADHVSRIAAYPLLLLPNTEYTDRRELYGFVTVQGERDDFEYVLSTKDVTLHENLQMQRFLFWARLLAENLVLRHIWMVLRALTGLGQSAAILSIADFVEGWTGPGGPLLRHAAEASTADPDSLAPALEFCFTEYEFDQIIAAWFEATILVQLPAAWQDPVAAVVQFDLVTRPLPDPRARRMDDAVRWEQGGREYWKVTRNYQVDVIAIIDLARDGSLSRATEVLDAPTTVTMLFPRGFKELARSTNHEETAHYVATIE